MGLSIQNEDVKSKEELQARGATPDRLIHDKKIWVTANDILKPLDQAITDGDIGAEVGVGSAYRYRTIVYGDGSTEEFGAQRPPYLNLDGNTVIETDYLIQNDAFIRVHVDKKEWIEYISDEVTPDFWWYRDSDQKIIIKGDLTGSPTRIEVQIMDGVDLPPIITSLYAGMDLLGDAYGYVDYSNGSAGISNIYVQGGKTRIVLETSFTKEDYVFVYINNEFYAPYKLGITTDKYYTLVEGNTVELDGDYSTQSLPFYIAVFRGKFFQDDLGNVCFEIGAQVREYSVTSPDTTVWGIEVTNEGEIVAESGSATPPDPIRLIRDDGQLVALEVTNEGDFVIDDNPSPGVAFANFYLVSPNGLAFDIGVTNDNVIYSDSSELSTNKFCLTDNYGNIIHEVQNTAEGAIFKLKHFNKGTLPSDPDQVTQNTLIAIEQDINGGPRMMQYDTFIQDWRPITGSVSEAPVGEVKHSILDINQFKEVYGDNWEPMNGTIQLSEIDHPELASLCPTWVDEGVITIPDTRDFDIEPQSWWKAGYSSVNHRQSGQQLEVPEGYVAGDLWAGISSISRIYYAGAVDGNDTTVNDFHIVETGGPTGNGYMYANIYNSEQRATAYAQIFALFRKLKNEQRYIKVK